MEPYRDHSEWRPQFGLRSRRSDGAQGSARLRAHARRLLRHEPHRPPPRRRDRSGGSARVRACGADRGRQRHALRWVCEGRADARVDEPRRSGEAGAGRIRGARAQRELAHRSLPRSQAADLWCPVSSRGRAYATGRGADRELSVRRVQGDAVVDDGCVHRRGSREDQGARRRREGDLRALRRRGLVGRRGVGTSRDRRRSSRASSSTTGCCGCTSASRWKRPFARTWASS